MTDPPQTPHVTLDEVERWQRGELPADQVVPVARHLAACARCREITAPRDLHRAMTSLRAQIEPEPDAAGLEAAAIAPPAPRRADTRVFARGWLASAAALPLLLLGAWWLRHDWGTRAPMGPTRTERAATDAPAAQRQALLAAPLEMPPILRELRPAPDVLRGWTADDARLAPAGVVVEQTRPELSWSAPEGALSRVIIYAGERQVAGSPRLRGTTWTPPAELERGVTYSWEVQIHDDGARLRVVPAPPAPAARFHVLAARAAEQLATARRRHAGDALVLGLLDARAGLEARARAELSLVQGEDRDKAQRLLREISSWRP